MVARGFLAKPSGLGIATSLIAALAVLLLCLAFEYVVPAADSAASAYLGSQNSNFRILILYAATGGFHIFLCSLGSALLFSRIVVETSKIDVWPVIRSFFLSFGFIFGVVLVGCALKLNVVVQSYHATMLPLRTDPRLGFLLSESDSVNFGFSFEGFALAPLALIMFGIGVAVIACFWISNRAINFIHDRQGIKPTELEQLKRDISLLISLISTIFTTSTVSTIIFLQMGRDWIDKGPVKDAYIQNGYAMSIFWSCCYSSVIIAMVAVPLAVVRRHAAKNELREETFYNNVHDVVSYRFASQAGIAVLMPILTSSVAALWGS